MTVRHEVATVLMLVALLAAPAAEQKDVPVADVLRATSDYLGAYVPKVSGLTLMEEYTLLDVTGGRMASTQRLTSDVVLINVSGKIVALRDAYAVDANPLRERQPRITILLAKPTLAGWDQAQAWAAATARYMMDTLVARSNEATLALQFADAANQLRGAAIK